MRKFITNERRKIKVSQINEINEYVRLQDTVCNLLRHQSPPEVGIDLSVATPIDYHYFKTILKEVAESKIHDPGDVYNHSRNI